MNTVATETTQTVIPERKIQPITHTDLKESEFVRPFYCATVPFGTQPNDLLSPEYWAHVANQLKPWARIEARAVDGTWFAEYVVLDVGRTWAKLHMLNQHNLTTPDVALSQANAMSPYEVKWRGPIAKWSVVRKSDSAVQTEGMSKEEAIGWVIAQGK